jgi:hypothetical protein
MRAGVHAHGGDPIYGLTLFDSFPADHWLPTTAFRLQPSDFGLRISFGFRFSALGFAPPPLHHGLTGSLTSPVVAKQVSLTIDTCSGR